MAEEKRAYISFNARINSRTAEALIVQSQKYVSDGFEEIYLLFSTGGGSVNDGMVLFNMLRGLPVRLIVHNTGNVDSIGNAVFLAGDERYAVANTKFMFHGITWGVSDIKDLSEQQAVELLASIRADQARLSQVFVDRTKLSEAEVSESFRMQRTMNAQEALTSGIIHEVRDVEIQPGSPGVHLAFEGGRDG